MKQHKNTLNVAKILACLLIVLSAVSTAPINSETSVQLGKNKPMKRNNGNPPKMFSKEDYKAWTNPCVADSYSTGDTKEFNHDRKEAYEKIKLTVDTVKEDLNSYDKINTSNYEAFDYFNAIDYLFLPSKPTNNHRKWHLDMQIYVATFGLLYKEQLMNDKEHNNNTLSSELLEIFKAARDLLCTIEDFVNSTNTERINVNDWFTRREMNQILNFKNLTDKLVMHRTYAKGRFQSYIKKLHDRITSQIDKPEIQTQSQSKYPKLRALKGRPAKRRKNGRKNAVRNGSPTKKIHTIRTTKMPRPFPKKRKNQRQRQSTASPIMQ